MKYTKADIKQFYNEECLNCRHLELCIVNRGLDEETEHWIGNCPKFFRFKVPYESYVIDGLKKQHERLKNSKK